MQILKRAKKDTSGEIVPFNEKPENVKEEVNRRTCRAGYTDSDGQPPLRPRQTDAGKGDYYRPVDKKRYDKNYERIFGHG